MAALKNGSRGYCLTGDGDFYMLQCLIFEQEYILGGDPWQRYYAEY